MRDRMGREKVGIMSTVQRQQGITLVELMIVIGIIGILVAIAAPSYTQYVRTARRAEAQQALLKAAAELEKLYGRRGSYSGAVFADDTSNLSNTEFPIGPTVSLDEDGQPGDYVMTNPPAVTANTFLIVATATGPQAADVDCATMGYDHAGQKYANGAPDVNGTCW